MLKSTNGLNNAGAEGTSEGVEIKQLLVGNADGKMVLRKDS